MEKRETGREKKEQMLNYFDVLMIVFGSFVSYYLCFFWPLLEDRDFI